MRKYIALVLALVCVLSLVGCSSDPKTFEIAGAEKLTVMSGSTGESIDITNADDIKHITDNINALKYSKGEKVNSDGWSYALQWFDQNGDIIENLTLLGDGYTIIYDGHYYKGMSVDYEIDLAFLESRFSNIDTTKPVFETDNINRITLFCLPNHVDGIEVPSEYIEDITTWIGTFTIDKEAGDLLDPGTNTFSFRLEYSDGTIVESGVNTTTIDGVTYYMKHDKAPECYDMLFADNKPTE